MTDLKFTIREPDIAYRDTMLWLPKSRVATRALCASLELEIGNQPLVMWKDAPHHVGVPRAMLSDDEILCPLIDLTPTFEHVDIRSKFRLDAQDESKTTQRDATRDLVEAEGGILNLACGAGKTVLLLHALSIWKQPAIIIADRDEVLEQWQGEIEAGLEFDGGIGYVRGKPDSWCWTTPIVLASIRSLAKYADFVPAPMARRFGRVIFDEAHHVGARFFNRAASIFFGHRYGATATVERGDGTETAYLLHIGPVIHSNLQQDLVPIVTFLHSPTYVDLKDPAVRKEVRSKDNSIHYRRLINYVANLPTELDFVEEELKRISPKRKALVLSLSVDQLIELHRRFPNSGLIIGDVKGAGTRRAALRDYPICFGTTDLAREALNERALDTLFLLVEFQKDGALQQATGRIQRILEGKLNPRVVVISHSRIAKLNRASGVMRQYFKRQGFRIEDV